MEKRVADEVDGAVDVLFHAKYEFERSAGFVAGEGRDVDELVVGIGDVLARLTVCVRKEEGGRMSMNGRSKGEREGRKRVGSSYTLRFKH